MRLIGLVRQTKKILILKIARYEKYVVLLVLTSLFCYFLMWAAKEVFKIYLPSATWATFLKSIEILALLISMGGMWLAWRTDKKQMEEAQSTSIHEANKVDAARIEERNNATFDKHSRIIAKLEAREDYLVELIEGNSRSIRDLQLLLGRLSAQVQESESKEMLRRKIEVMEKIITRMQQKG